MSIGVLAGRKTRISNFISVDFFLSLLLNVFFVIFYMDVYDPFFETNDDPTIAFFPEGIWGMRFSRLIFENTIFGKMLETLQSSYPSVRWYVVIQYTMVFVAFIAIGYILIKMLGRAAGTTGIVLLLMLVGQHIYVTFQWTRVTAVTTAAGICLLFYAINFARGGAEKVASLLIGGLLCIFGSFIRFEMFAVCVVLAGGIGFCRLVFLLMQKNEDWKKFLVRHLVVFGSVGILCMAGYMVNKFCYQSEEWQYYMGYNSLRSDLWDLGFPDYGANQELYESLGISQSDLSFYLQWNMDEEKLPLESLEQLVNAKEKKTIVETFNAFIAAYPKSFFTMPFFGVFLLASLIAVLLNKKNLLLALYEFAMLMGFEFYFVYIGRAGLPRIDESMLMASILVMACCMVGERVEVRMPMKVAIALCGGIFAINMADIGTRIINRPKEEVASISPEKEFLDLLSRSDNNLYIMPTLSYGDFLVRAYDFWTPASLGDARNICFTGGWDFNTPARHYVMQLHGVSNIYRDCIDNDDVLFVTYADPGGFLGYVIENYDANARLCQVKKIACQGWENAFYKVRDAEIGIPRRTKTASSDIVHEVHADTADGAITISGYAYKANSDSFQQFAYLKLKDMATGDVTYYDLVLGNWEGSADIMNGAYSAISGSYPIEEGKEYEASVILEADGEYYELDCAR